MRDEPHLTPPSGLAVKPIGIIIAGGMARRLGGGDKTLRALAGRPILAWLIERLAPQCATLALNANGPPDRFAAFGIPVVADDSADDGQGPLAGVLASLEWVAVQHPAVASVLTVPADVPLPPVDLVQRLAARRQALQVAAARSGRRRHPLAALWPVVLRQDLARFLRQRGQRRVEAFLEENGVTWEDWPAVPFDPFHNVNTPDDLASAEQWIAEAARQ